MKHRKLNTALLLTSLILSACGEEDSGSATLDPGPTLTLEAPGRFHFTWSKGETPVTHYRLLENPDGQSGFTDVSGDLPVGTESFTLEVPLHLRVNARYLLERCNFADCSNSQQVIVSGNLAELVDRIEATDTRETALVDDNFGYIVAISGNHRVMAVGSKHSVYIFAYTEEGGGSWQQRQKIESIEQPSNISISKDGSRLAIADNYDLLNVPGISANLAAAEEASNNGDGVTTSPTASIQEFRYSGAVSVYAFTGSNWEEEAYIKASNLDHFDEFGYAISLSDDGSRLAVGAPYEDSTATGTSTTFPDFDSDASDLGDDRSEGIDAGAVYIYSRSDTTWQEDAYIKASNAGIDDRFGTSVSLSGEGNWLAVGAIREDSSTAGAQVQAPDGANSTGADNSGAVYIYLNDDSEWTEEAFIKAINTGSDDYFGREVSLSDDGDRLVVSASHEDSSLKGVYTPAEVNNLDNNDAENSGATYVYQRSGSSWAAQAYIKASNTGPGDLFGWTFSFTGDGQYLAIWSPSEDSDALGVHASTAEVDNNDGNDSSATYVFSFDGSSWRQRAFVKPTTFFGRVTDPSSARISLSDDGNTLVVGIPDEDLPIEDGEKLGAVYIY